VLVAEPGRSEAVERESFHRRSGRIAALLAPFLVSALSFSLEPSPDFLVLEDFEEAPLRGLPADWKTRRFAEGETVPSWVDEENGNRFLRAEDRGQNVMLYKEVRWSSEEFPYLSFRWRIRAVPEGADERHEDRSDSAAGIYLSYRRKLGIVPESVKFVWSGSLATGLAFRRPGMGMPWTVVAGNGSPDDAWRTFVFRTEDVYRKTFGAEPGERPLGIGLLTDADSTKSLAAADYDDIVVHRRPPGEVAEVREVLGTLSH
jgi:hypothetical protein